MWSPSAPLIRVGLSPQGLAIARLPRFGLGLGMGLSLARQAAVEYLPCSGSALASAGAAPAAAGSASGHAPWRAAVDTLAQWLAAHKNQRLNVQLVLGERLTRWQLLPWQAELSGPDERAAYAALRFRETYGRAADDWQVLPASVPPGHTAPAAAVDRALMDALDQACGSSGARLHSVTPYFSAAFDAWRSALKGQSVWFATLEPDCLSLGLLQGGQWTALQTQKTLGHWQAPLHALLTQTALACAVHEPLALYLVGDKVGANASTNATATATATATAPLTLAGQPCTWLQPQPLHSPTPPGLRLAMGC